MEIPVETAFMIKEKDIQTFTTKDTGAGGQHRNKTESCVIMRHLPTGIEAKASARCQHQNRRTTRALLEARVQSHTQQLARAAADKNRLSAKGSGMRGDKVRTYRERDDQVTDHRSNVKMRLRDVLAGNLTPLWR